MSIDLPNDSRPIFGIIPRSAIRYAAVGVVNTVFGYGVIYSAMYFASVGTELANALGYGAGFVLSFFLNRRITFRSRAVVAKAMPRFALVTTIAYCANLVAVIVLERGLGLNPYWAQAGGLFPYLAIGYLGSRFFVFGERRGYEASAEDHR